jgi:hypothetical protein
MEQVDKHLLGKARVWKRGCQASSSFFDYSNLSFDFTNMFTGRWNIKSKHWNKVFQLLELIVHEHRLDSEACPSIYASNSVD